jgi:rRNA biogenesis protein RRP5
MLRSYSCFGMLKNEFNPLDLKTISQFALLEYKHGEPERGKTLFEGIIDSHPKRWDLWSIYMDMEANQQNIQGLRYVRVALFTSQELKSRQ